MTASTTKTPEAEAPAPAPLVGGGRRARADTGFQWLSLGAAVLVLAILLGTIEFSIRGALQSYITELATRLRMWAD